MGYKADYYIVRWEHPTDDRVLMALPAGSVVKLKRYCENFQLKDNEVDHHVAQVQVIGVKGKTGYVRADYLQPAPKYDTGFPQSQVGRDMEAHVLMSRDLWDCRWYVSPGNPVEMAVRMRADPAAPFGSFIVVGVPEQEIAFKGHWRPLILAVKWFSGLVSNFADEQRRDRSHEIHINNTKATCFNRYVDNCFGDSGVAYIPILRTKAGRYLLQGAEKCVFSSIFILINYWRGRQLPLNRGPPLTLTQPFQVLKEPVLGPAPQSKGVLPVQPVLQTSGLFAWPKLANRVVCSFTINPRSESFSGRTDYALVFGQEKNENSCRTATKWLNMGWYNENAFAIDLDLIDVKKRHNNERLPKINRKSYVIAGMEYITKIMGHSIPWDPTRKKPRPFVAYEIVPNVSLSTALINGRHLSPRAIVEIIYQVAAAMHHLEINQLCHRCLNASNVIINWDDELSVSVKVTDYMLPGHHLVTNPEEIGNGAVIKEVKWKWMSPEALTKGVFDIVSDTWSFGCLIFEICTGGLEPYAYEKKKMQTPYDLIAFFANNHRMTTKKQTRGPVEARILYRECCNVREKRPSFSKIVRFCAKILFNHTGTPIESKKKLFENL